MAKPAESTPLPFPFEIVSASAPSLKLQENPENSTFWVRFNDGTQGNWKPDARTLAMMVSHKVRFDSLHIENGTLSWYCGENAGFPVDAQGNPLPPDTFDVAIESIYAQLRGWEWPWKSVEDWNDKLFPRVVLHAATTLREAQARLRLANEEHRQAHQAYDLARVTLNRLLRDS